MAGNVKEWCLNAVEGQPKRYILGGGWNEPSYRYNEADAQNPWERRATFGVRLMKNLGPGRRRRTAGPRRGARSRGDRAGRRRGVRGLQASSTAYDRLPLDARVEAVDDSSPDYRKETVSFAAAYGGERVPAYLFLPKNASRRTRPSSCSRARYADGDADRASIST